MNKRDGVANQVRGCGTDEKTRLICVDHDGDGHSGQWEIEENNPDYPPCKRKTDQDPEIYCKEDGLNYDPGSPENSRITRYPSRYQDTSCIEGKQVHGWDGDQHGWNCEWWIQEHPKPAYFLNDDLATYENE